MSESNWIEDVEIGDSLRYLGGDPSDTEGESLVKGKIYEIIYDDIYGATIDIGDDTWGIGDEYKNTACFELVEDEETETGAPSDDNISDMLISLSMEVTSLKRRMGELETNMTARTEFERFAATAEDARMVAGKAREDVLALAYDLDEMRRRLNSEEGERLIEEFREFIESRRN